ncbi:MAG TPA: CPCC family cysteine-rich protein [Polyangium sp.]|nr:CPCC family cysteine-rich protein [Polyangium sp.]
MEACPCCGYMTLDELGHYDICEVCWWEDDGQDNDDADRVWGGPNRDSLTKARVNFIRYGINTPAEGPPKIANPAATFARGRVFVMVDDGSAVEEPAVGWRSERF